MDIFHSAVIGDTNQLQSALNNKININTLSSDKCIPLHYSVLHDHFEFSKVLVENMSNIDQPNSKGISPLHIAVNNGNEKIVNLLIQHKANVNITDNIIIYIHRVCFSFTKYCLF